MLGNREISVLNGRNIVDVKNINNEVILFKCRDGDKYKMYHQQDCCESVIIEEIIGGDLESLIGETVVEAREDTNEGITEHGTATWTFYHIRTNKDTVTIRWCGESNGYYSESVCFIKMAPSDEYYEEV